MDFVIFLEPLKHELVLQWIGRKPQSEQDLSGNSKSGLGGTRPDMGDVAKIKDYVHLELALCRPANKAVEAWAGRAPGGRQGVDDLFTIVGPCTPLVREQFL